MKTLFSGRFVLELALANICRSPVPQFGVGVGTEENEIIKERNQDCQFCTQGTAEQWDQQQTQADKRKPFKLERQNKEDVDLHVRVKRGESKEKR